MLLLFEEKSHDEPSFMVLYNMYHGIIQGSLDFINVSLFNATYDLQVLLVDFIRFQITNSVIEQIKILTLISIHFHYIY